MKHSIERPAALPDLPARDTAYHGLVSASSYGLPPIAVRRLSLGLSPPGRAILSQAPVPFIGVTVLLI